MQDLAGRVAVVTGAASGIGRALAAAFVAEGMRVVLADVEEPALAAVAGELAGRGADVHAVGCDVSDPAAVDALAQATVERFGAAHVLCNNAGVAGGGLSWKVPLREWEWIIGVNLWGVVHGIRSFLPVLLEQDEAHVVNTASIAGLTGAPFMGPYCASKHAVVGLSQSLHHEVALHGGSVRVHVVCPGWVRTRISESDRNRPARFGGPGGEGPAEMGAAAREALQSMLDQGMDPDEVATQVLDAMAAGRFWVLTHRDDRWRAAVDDVHASVREGTNPSFVGLL